MHDVAHSSNTWLLQHSRNVFSQAGEDGIIEAILERLPQRDNWCVEFGAWDGKFLSNSRNLILHHGFSAVLIEGGREKFRELQETYAGNGKITTLNGFVGFGAHDNLDTMLGNTPIPRDFDVLSIDIDGNDYHVWKAMNAYAPKVVCVEFNPTIPTEVSFVQEADRHVTQGCSLRAIVELGRQKGYELISVLAYNAIFVRSEYFPHFDIKNNAPEVLRTNLDHITYIFSGYDGRVFLRGSRTLPWHGIPLREEKVQHLPAFCQAFPDNYSALQSVAYRLCKDPVAYLRDLLRKCLQLLKIRRS